MFGKLKQLLGGRAAPADGEAAPVMALCQRLLDVDPGNAGATEILGLLEKGGAPAGTLLERARVLCAQAAETRWNAGNAHRDQGRPSDAIACYDVALRLRPDYAEAHYKRANALQDLGRFADSMVGYDEAIALRPAYAEAHTNLGNALRAQGQLAEALESYDRAITHQPLLAIAHNNRGVVLLEQKNPADALKAFDRALEIRADYVDALNNAGNALMALKDPDAALQRYDRALALLSDHADAHSNRGNALRSLRRLEDALASYDRAVSLQPRQASAWFNRGLVLKEFLRLDEAVESYNRALALRPDHAEAAWSKALVLLLQGRLPEAWPLHESRWKLDDVRPHARKLAQPLWNGGPVSGRTVLLHCEQGLGDTIQFSRYAAGLAQRGARVVLEVQRPLVPLLSGGEGISGVFASGGPLPEFDLHCPLMSLPLAFGTTLATLPAPQKLDVAAEKLARWEERLGKKAGPRVGLVWSGSTLHPNDHNRSLRLARLLAAVPRGITCVSLQREVHAVDGEELSRHPEVAHFGEELRDFTDTAALCSLVDVVLTVDTSVAHLAATLGRPTWILLPWLPDWRWLLERTDSPWYPTATLYRQAVSSDWTGVLQRVTADLQRLAG